MLLSSTSGHVNSTRWLARLRRSNAQLYGQCRDLSPAVMGIQRFAATLKVGKFRAVDVARDEVYKESAPFWLCLLMEPAFQLSDPHDYAGNSFDEGWWVLKFQWLKFDGLDSIKQRRYFIGLAK